MISSWYDSKEWLEELIDSDGPEAHHASSKIFSVISQILGVDNLEFSLDSEFDDLQDADKFIESFKSGTHVSSGHLVINDVGYYGEFEIYQDASGKKSMIVYEESTGGITVYRGKS